MVLMPWWASVHRKSLPHRNRVRRPVAVPSHGSPIRLPDFARTHFEARQRFRRTRGIDPFPDIPPALLNSADLLDYIAATGMIYPFEINPGNPSELLKPASCGIRLAGDVLYWDTTPDGGSELVTQTLGFGEELCLKRNSIVYVTLEPMLQLPDYIAARFNLTIRDIYRGILVGTGPLVDPGFTGRLSLPLHNLTFNNYVIKGGEPLVWMEFTKLSVNTRWAGASTTRRRGTYIEFPDRKRKRRTVNDYVKYASGTPITSSIPPLVERAEQSAKAAQEQVTAQTRRFTRISIIAALALFAAIATILISVYSLVDSSDASRRDLTQQVDTLEHQVEVLRKSQTGRGVATTP
jgi:deoxycytidine triphosphate deaminase